MATATTKKNNSVNNYKFYLKLSVKLYLHVFFSLMKKRHYGPTGYSWKYIKITVAHARVQNKQQNNEQDNKVTFAALLTSVRIKIISFHYII